MIVGRGYFQIALGRGDLVRIAYFGLQAMYVGTKKALQRPLHLLCRSGAQAATTPLH
jgi:hypothetical protein